MKIFNTISSRYQKVLFVGLIIFAVTIAFLCLREKGGMKPSQKIITPPLVSVGKIEDITSFYTITAKFPLDTRDTLNVVEEYVEHLVAQKQEEWRIGGEAYTAEQQVSTDFPDRPAMIYELNINYKSFASERFQTVSYLLGSYEFTGGAHGLTIPATFTFGSQGRIAIEDIIDFVSNRNDILLTRLLAQKALAQLGDMTNKTMVDGGLGLAYLASDGITFNRDACRCDGFFFPSNFQNFIIEDDGIVFVMNQYQVAPYAVGMPEILFTWDELGPFLNLENPLGL